MYKIYSKLEFDLVLNEVSKLAYLDKNKVKIQKLKHRIDYNEVVNELKITDEAMKLFHAHLPFSLEGYYDLEDILKKVKQKKDLDGISLFEVAKQYEVIISLLNYLKEIKEDNFEYISNKIRSLHKLESLSKEIDLKVASNGLIYEDATPTLVKIKKDIDNTNARMHEQLRGFIDKNSSHLMENVITYRNNRSVVLVKATSKNAIKGIVHDESSSKQTVFIEPSFVVEFNNQLQSLEYQKTEEVNAVLQALSLLVSESYDELVENATILESLDIIKAKALYSMNINGIIPKINEESAKLEIFNGRHPLIDSKVVVPNDFFMCNNETKYRIVMISGSNTGGKTVALKMVGLFSLMCQTGLAISANEKSNMPIYSSIFVDIGDEQSIENNLSTFSSHLNNVSNIVNKVGKYSLVLLDELGSGTDPRQGENLALAILEYLYEKDASVIVTTHYSKLKNYGITNDHVRSASVVFDGENNKPKFQIAFDSFASSNALEIALYLGLKKEIINKAYHYYNEDLDTTDELMLKLSRQQIALDKKNEELEKQIASYALLNDQALQLNNKALLKYESLQKQAKEESNQLLRETKIKADQIIKDLKKQQKFVNHEVNDIVKQLDDSFFSVEQSKQNDDHVYNIGDIVNIVKINREGEIAKLLSKNSFEVNIGNIKTKVKKNEVIFVRKSSKEKVAKNKARTYSSKKVSLEVNLIGLRVDDALIELVKYLDDAILANLNTVRVIHGFGTGALRTAVHGYLKKSKHVKTFYYAQYSEGGQGATIVELK